MKNRNNDKKGNLMENSTDLVIAVIILVILFFATVKIYTSFLQDREINSAKNFANALEQKIIDIPDGAIVKKTMGGVNGEDWFLSSFDFSDLNRPDACFETPCLAVCKGGGNDKEVNCRVEGKSFFKKMKFDEIEVISYDLNGPTKKKQVNPRIETEEYVGYILNEKNHIAFEKNKLVELEIEKKTIEGKKILVITHYTDKYIAHKDEIKK